MAHVETLQDLDIRVESPSAPERRKARKRELDRIAQQKKRKSDRETISKLKAQVKAFEQQSDHSQVYRLIFRLEKDQEKLKRHLERVKQIEALIQADFKDLGEDDFLIPLGSPTNNNILEIENRDDTLNGLPVTSHNNRPPLSSDTACVPNQQVSGYPRSHLDAMSWEEPIDVVQASPNSDLKKPSPEDCMNLEDNASLNEIFSPSDSVDLSKLPALSAPLQDSSEPDLILAQGNSPLAGTRISQCQDFNRSDSMWSVCDSAIIQGQALILYSGDNLQFGGESDAHIIITAITEGWGKAAKSHYWNGYWDSLRQIDQYCHSMCGPVERMAVLYILSQLFKYQRFPGDPLSVHLPAYLRARPSQLSVPHAPVVDHFIWPGFRERLVFDNGKYHNDTFSNDYGLSLRFLWPYELRDTYLKNRQTGIYQYSNDFMTRANDVRCFTMKLQFFEKYPEFQGDVPVFDSVPGTMSALGDSKAIFSHFLTPNRALQKRGRKRRRAEVVEEDETRAIVSLI